jgi:DNA primase
MPVPDRRDPVAQTERTALEVVLQQPALVPIEFDALASDAFAALAYRAVHEAVRAAGGVAAARAAQVAAGGSATGWVGMVSEQAAEPVRALVTELAVAPLPEDRPESLPNYVRGVVMSLIEIGYTRHIAELRGRLQRMDPAAEGYRAAYAELVEVEGRRRMLRESA